MPLVWFFIRTKYLLGFCCIIEIWIRADPFNMGESRAKSSTTLFTSPQEFFSEVVREALSQRKLSANPLTEEYLINLMQHYVHAGNLFDEDEESGQRQKVVLAELLLKAASSPTSVRIELLKRLGDTSLYISGFFGDSLSRQIVDVDYYADMGGTAYGSLAETVREDSSRVVFSEMAEKFLSFVEVLNYISSKSLPANNQNILRLYDKLIRTGSDLARQQLLEQGIIAPQEILKKTMQ